jgi:hypothetical protein
LLTSRYDSTLHTLYPLLTEVFECPDAQVDPGPRVNFLLYVASPITVNIYILYILSTVITTLLLLFIVPHHPILTTRIDPHS